MYNIGFLRAMSLAKEDIAKRKDKPAGEAYLTLKKFLEQGSYSTYKKAGLLATHVLGGYSDSYTARALDISEATLRVHKRNISIELYNLFGEDFFELLSNYTENKQEILNRLSIISTFNLSSRDILPEELLVILSSLKGGCNNLTDDDVSISACEREISYLVRHSLNLAKRELESLDTDKLIYLINLLDKNIEAKNRGELLSKIYEEGGLEDVSRQD